MSTGDAELGKLKTFNRPGGAPMIPLDHALRLKWLTGSTRHEGRGRGDHDEPGRVLPHTSSAHIFLPGFGVQSSAMFCLRMPRNFSVAHR